jgi:hypothetical protein
MNDVRKMWLAVIFSALSAKPTTIILQLRDDADVRERVILAADSMGVLTDEHGVSHEAQCKIAVHRRVVFAVAGLVHDATGGFDAYREMESSLDLPGSFTVRMRIFQDRMLMNLNLRQNTGKTLEVVAIDADHFPRHYLGVFAPLANGSWRVEPASGIREKLGYPVRYLLLGVRDHIASELTSTPRRFEDTSSGVASLVELEERSHPNLVGGSISMVKIQKGVIQWLSTGPCAFNGNPAPRSIPDAPTTFR